MMSKCSSWETWTIMKSQLNLAGTLSKREMCKQPKCPSTERMGKEDMIHISVSISSVAQSCPTLCDPMDCSTPGLPVHHQLLEFTQTHVDWVNNAIQPSHPLSSPSPAFNLSQHQGLFKRVNSSHRVAKVLEFQLQHQSFQWILRTDFI